MGVIRNGIYSGIAVAEEQAGVSNARRDVYQLKREMVKTPMVREIVAVTFTSEYLPKQVFANSSGVYTRPYDAASGTYHPNGVHVYTPEVAFGWTFSEALLTLFQDLYPNADEMNRVNSTELAEQLENDTWQVTLTLKDECLGKVIHPAFDIFNIENTPVESLPLVLEDGYTKSSGAMGTISLVLGVLSLALTLVSGLAGLGGMLCSFVAAITALISIRTTPKGKKKDKKAIFGLLFALTSWFLPSILAILQLKSFLGI